MSVKDRLAAMEGYLTTAKLEESKLAGGCKSSAARCRNALLELAKACSDVRKDVLEVGKAVPTKKRAPKSPEEVKPESEESEEEKVTDAPVVSLVANVLEALRVSDAASLAAEDAPPLPPVLVSTKKPRARKPNAPVSA